MKHRISIITNAVIAVLFILLGIIGVVNNQSQDASSIILLAFMLFACGISLFFDLVCYRILSVNKEKSPLPDWIKSYGTFIFVLSILAVLIVLFLMLAVAVAFFVAMQQSKERQLPFFIIFFILMLISVVTYILNAVGYFRSLKHNKHILNEYIDNIGSPI